MEHLENVKQTLFSDYNTSGDMWELRSRKVQMRDLYSDGYLTPFYADFNHCMREEDSYFELLEFVNELIQLRML